MKTWLARNDLIFNNNIQKLETVASKAKAFLLEAVGSHQIDGTKLEVDLNWLGTKQVVNTQIGFNKPVIKPFWQVGLSANEFS